MVSAEELNELFEYRDGFLYGKYVPWRRKESNTRVVGKVLGLSKNGTSGHTTINFRDKRGEKHHELTHRVIFMMHHGWVPKCLDHLDRDPTNNRIENLRPACKSLNSQNRGSQVNTKWGMRGIYRDKHDKYQVYIGINYKRFMVGYTSCIAEAWRLRVNAEIEYWPNARPNEVSPFARTKGFVQQD